MGALIVLLWKHLIVRKRRFIQTPVELISPIIYLLIMFLYKDKIIPVRNFDRYNEVKNTEPFTIDLKRTLAHVFYTPETELTNSLMDEAGAKLNFRRLDHMPGSKEKGYYPFPDSTSGLDYSQEMGPNDAIIVFQDINGTWPNNLEYTIRMKDNFDTHSYTPGDGNLGPHENFGTIYEKFMLLQWVIDTSYLRLLTGADVAQNLMLQEFPYSKAKENSSAEIVCFLLDTLCPLSLVPVFVFLMSKLLDEKNSGIQELVKMVGVSSKTLGLSHLINVMPAGVLYSAVGAALLKATDLPLLPHSNGFILYMALLLHFTSIVALAFAFAYLINTKQHVTSLSVFAYLLTWMPCLKLVQLAPRLWPLLGLLPHVPLHWIWQECAAQEHYGVGVWLSNMAETGSPERGSALLALVYTALQTALWLLLAWYFSLTRPGDYGQALPWSFPFTRQYWSESESKSPKVETAPEEAALHEAPDERYFEPPPAREPGIRILNVTKAFPKHVALSNVTLDVYKGEITVLLGHNGAGKTTLMSIITGLMSPTSGRVLVDGLDARAQRSSVRAQLGLCPQHNLFFPDLTVREHAMFFALLKGQSFSEARDSADNLLKKLNIHDKADARTDELSGGMKRRLQLACALAGGASVLVLDEPTSGLDVETRRELWDLLLTLRGSRTVLLTTHFMEEADALGDRVAALHAGRLRCHATTMFLKRAVGTGYRLSLTTQGAPDEASVTRAVRAAVPAAELRDRALGALAYTLPASETPSFPKLFASLEDRRSELGIESIGVGKSTLDDVFLRLCSDVQTSFADEQGDASSPDKTYKKLTGLPLYLRQFSVLVKRQFYYITSKIYSFALLQVLIPVAFIFMVTNVYNDGAAEAPRNEPTALDLDLYKDMAQRRVLYNTEYQDSVDILKNAYKKVEFEKADDVAEAVLSAGKRDILEYNKYLVGVELNDTHAKALFTTTVRHAAPVALNLLSNMLAARLAGGADGRTLRAHIQPLEGAHAASPGRTITEPKSTVMLLMWTVSICFAILSTLSSNMSLACAERASGARHLHLMSGCGRALHWASCLAAQLCAALPLLLLPALLAPLLLDTERTTCRAGFLMALLVALCLGTLAFSACIYLLSAVLPERGAGALAFVAIVVFSFITPTMYMGARTYGETSGAWWRLLQLAALVAPPHALTVAVGKSGLVARLNALCELNRGRCPALLVAEHGFDARKCCESSSEPFSYFSLDEQAPGNEFIIMAVQFVVFWVLVLLADDGVFGRAWDNLLSARLPTPKPRFHDAMVRAESAYVEKAIQLPKKQISESMLCYDVYKNYPSIFKKSCFAVKGISFSVKKGECFGLLGVNGAGKSTTFRMLTGEAAPTRGSMFANQFHLHEKTQYMRTLSYCPQFLGLDEFLTGRQSLELVLALRGLGARDASHEASAWLQQVGLEQYADRRVSGYSGGMARRLAAAAALCQHAGAALLDEPTAGVDAAARRRLHCALRRAQRAGALLIASHSMEEMEALCDRIAILSGGWLCALGGAGALRAHHAAGHALVFKLRAQDALDGDDAGSATDKFKGDLHRAFDCALKDEHQTMLHYRINDTLRYSELFATVEALKQAYPNLVEDYSVSETTLEEVFLSFARDAQEHGPAV